MSEAQPPYGAPTPEPRPVVSVIDARAGRRLNNALTLTFFEGSVEPFAVAQQGAADGLGKKMGILFGFKNGAPGRHVLSYTDGGTLVMHTKDAEPSPVTRGDGSEVATITRGATSSATLPDGSALLGFRAHPVEATSDGKFRMQVTDAHGAETALLEVIRQGGSWALGAELADYVLWGNTQTGSALPIPFQGARVVVHRTLTPVEREVLLAVCVDIGIGVRPYFTEMGSRGAAGT